MSRAVAGLRACPQFRTEPARTLRRLGRMAESFDVSAGRLLLVEGDPSNDLYLIVDGAVVVHAEHQELAYLAAGQIVGEIGVITGRPRSASVETIARSRFLRINGDQFRAAFRSSNTLQGRTCDLIESRAVGAAEARRRTDRLSVLPRLEDGSNRGQFAAGLLVRSTSEDAR